MATGGVATRTSSGVPSCFSVARRSAWVAIMGSKKPLTTVAPAWAMRVASAASIIFVRVSKALFQHEKRDGASLWPQNGTGALGGE